MSDLGLTPDEIIAQLSNNRTSSYIYMAALALGVYDILLALPQEVKCIWGKKFNAVALLYLLIRYGTAVNLFLQVFNILFINSSVPSCKAENIFVSVIDVICHFTPAIFECLRIWGICHHKWMPTTLVFILSMFDPIVLIYTYALPILFVIVPSGPLVGCWAFALTATYPFLPVITRASTIASNIAILGLTLWETMGLFKASQEIGNKNSLSLVLVRNGCVQFCIVLILNVISIVLSTLDVTSEANISHGTTFIYLQQMITSIILSHFILDLRSVHYGAAAAAAANSTGTPSLSVRFATYMSGNIGASLDDSWARGTRDSRVESEESEEIQYSECPLAVGLFTSPETHSGSTGFTQEYELEGLEEGLDLS